MHTQTGDFLPYQGWEEYIKRATLKASHFLQLSNKINRLLLSYNVVWSSFRAAIGFLEVFFPSYPTSPSGSVLNVWWCVVQSLDFIVSEVFCFTCKRCLTFE